MTAKNPYGGLRKSDFKTLCERKGCRSVKEEETCVQELSVVKTPKRERGEKY